MLGDYNQVSVFPGSLAGGKHCSVKRCKRKDRFQIFIDDGKPMLSRLFSSSCSKHLALMVDRAWKKNRELQGGGK